MCTCNGVFTLSETENDFCSETDEMALKVANVIGYFQAISLVSLQEIVLGLAQCENTITLETMIML